jgi:hypothetical protein
VDIGHPRKKLFKNILLLKRDIACKTENAAPRQAWIRNMTLDVAWRIEG